jgi:hypothetical protein
VAEPKDFVYLLDNCPHDWLFLQCKAVVSHSLKRLSFSILSDLYNVCVRAHLRGERVATSLHEILMGEFMLLVKTVVLTLSFFLPP